MIIEPMKLRRQQGVISVMAAVTLTVAVVVAALALDLGRIYWIKRDLQKAADLASLSAVTEIPQATTVAQNIALANGFDYQKVATANSMTVTTGMYNWTTRVFTPGGDPDTLDAVQVIVATTIPYYFMPGSLRLEASAISVRDPVAGFSLGSFIARLDTTQSALLNSVLGGLLGGAINLDIGSYKGLAAGTVSLAGLQLALGLGTVDEVLNANLSLAGLLDATITALNNKGDAASVNAASILGTVRTSVASNRSLRVGDLLNVDTSNPQAAANTEVNVMQLLQTGAQIANGSHFVDIPNLGVSVGSLANVGLGLSVIEPPTIAIGPARKNSNGQWMTRAHAAQIRLKLGLKLDLAVLQVNLPLYIESGAADASLTKIVCKLPRDDSEVTIEATPQLVAAYIGNVDNAVMENHAQPVTPTTATLVNVLGLITIKGYAKVVVGGGQPRDLVFNGPFDQYNTTATASLGIGSALGTALQQPGNMDTKVELDLLGLLKIDAGPIIAAIIAVLNSVLDALLDPLLSLLGVSLGGADVTAFYLNCGVPQLVH
ncbi:MAG TPA: TadG family pilus assembly protein [Gallionella sp.]|nr:TadG family pilus assembly protein [Gallionella sp.]